MTAAGDTIVHPNAESSTRISRDTHHSLSGTAASTAVRSTSAFGSMADSTSVNRSNLNYFRSRRVGRGEVQRPWLDQKDPRQKWQTIIPCIGIGIGIIVSALGCWQGYTSVHNYNYCPVLVEDFSSGILDSNIWTKEVEVGGFGNGQFEETTDTDENVFIHQGELWIKPTIQNASLIENNSILNLTQQGICTSADQSSCVATTNVTNGTIVNPVKPARINTIKGAIIKYGRVEVIAQLPSGDWMWPAIWLLPVNNTYGPWPASGEIDIAESRGNNHSYQSGGNNVVASTLHWGPDSSTDAWARTSKKTESLHSTYSAGFHTFGLEWSSKYLITYIDSRLAQVLYVPFKSPRWAQGDFPSAMANGTRIVDPWSQTGSDSTPFDQPFYLILNVAVGSTNSWWKDGVDGKPWVDASVTAKKDFWDARDQWLPTWGSNGQMRIRSVKMWQQAGYEGCKEG